MVVPSQGEARSAELIGDAIKKSRSYVDLKRIENARAIAQILAGGWRKEQAVFGLGGSGTECHRGL